MPYETASASSTNDLIDKLRIFALAEGWTIDYHGGRTNPGGGAQAGSNNALLLHKSGLYACFYTDTSSNTSTDPTPRIACYTYPGPFVSNDGTDLQAGKTATSAANALGGPYVAYHFFLSDATPYLHVVLEVTSGRFAHLGVGVLDKSGGGTAVAYGYGLRWNWTIPNDYTSMFHNTPWQEGNSSSTSPGGLALRADSDSISPRNYELRDAGAARAFGGWLNTGRDLGQQFMRLGPSALTGRTILVPPIVMVERGSGSFSLAGSPHDLRLVRIDNLAPGEIITIGADDWKVFPVIRKNGPSGVENSAAFGYAYRVLA